MQNQVQVCQCAVDSNKNVATDRTSLPMIHFGSRLVRLILRPGQIVLAGRLLCSYCAVKCPIAGGFGAKCANSCA